MAAQFRSLDVFARARRAVSIAAGVAFVLGAAGCEGSSATTPGSPVQTTLTPADQLVIASRVALPAAVAVGMLAPDLSTALVHGVPVSSAAAPRRSSGVAGEASSVAALATYPVDRTVNCVAGGSAHTTGTLSGSLSGAGSGSLNFLLFTSFANCQVTSGTRTLVLSADPGLKVSGGYAVTNRVPADPQSFSLSGTVNVSESGSRAVAFPCVVDLTVTTSASTHVATATGTVCGAAVSSQLLWSP